MSLGLDGVRVVAGKGGRESVPGPSLPMVCAPCTLLNAKLLLHAIPFQVATVRQPAGPAIWPEPWKQADPRLEERRMSLQSRCADLSTTFSASPGSLQGQGSFAHTLGSFIHRVHGVNSRWTDERETKVTDYMLRGIAREPTGIWNLLDSWGGNLGSW